MLQYRSGDLLSRIVADIGTLENFYIRAVAPPLVALLVAELMWIFLGSFDPRLALAVIAMMLLAGVGVPLLSQILSRQPGSRVVTVRANLNAVLVDGIQGTADLVAFRAEAAQVSQVRALSDALGREQARLTGIGGLNNTLGSLLTSLAVVVVLALAIPLVTSGRIAGVSLAVLALTTAASFEAVLPLPLASQFLESSLAAARRLFEVVATDGIAVQLAPALESEIIREQEASLLPSKPPSIEVSHLTLRYAAESRLRLTTSPSACPPVALRRSSVRAARVSLPWPTHCCGFRVPRPARSGWTGATCAMWRRRPCAGRSVLWRSRRICST